MSKAMVKFPGRVLMVGFGSVAQCTLPILVKHVQVPLANITVLDFEDKSAALEPWTSQGVRFVRQRITPENLGAVLGKYLAAGRPADRPGLEHRLLRDPPVVPRPRRALHQHLGRGVGPVRPHAELRTPPQRTLYWRHMNLRRIAGQLVASPARPPCSSTAPTRA